MDNYDVLASAIEERRPLVGLYDGRRREFCPHAIGTKRGEPHVLVYQTGGESKSGLPEGGEWRCLRVDELDEVEDGAGPWQTSANLFNPQSCLDEIDEVAQPFPAKAT